MKESWYQRTWRPFCAAVYLLICLMDFVIMPHLIYRYDYSKNNKEIVELAQHFNDANVQKEIINSLSNARHWEPLTLMGGGMFHMSFGAILGVAAYSRGRDKYNNDFNEYNPKPRMPYKSNNISQDEYDVK
jgi:hypothetical protein